MPVLASCRCRPSAVSGSGAVFASFIAHQRGACACAVVTACSAQCGCFSLDPDDRGSRIGKITAAPSMPSTLQPPRSISLYGWAQI